MYNTDNVLLSYRQAFVQKHNGAKAVLTDNELDEIITEIGILPNREEETNLILAAMFDASQRNSEDIRAAQISYAGY